MLDFLLMLRVKLLVVDRIHPSSNKFAMGVGNEVKGDSKLYNSPVWSWLEMLFSPKRNQCAVPKNIHNPPTEGIGISQRGGGVGVL